MSQNAEKVRRYRRRAEGVGAAVLVLFGAANLDSPIGNRWQGAVMLIVGLGGLASLRWERS